MRLEAPVEKLEAPGMAGLCAVLAVLALAGCGRERGAPASTSPPVPASVEVRHFGALRTMVHEGQTGPTVALDAVVPGPHTYGVGALSELRGEVTIDDDVVWLAYPTDEGGVDVRSSDHSDEHATLLVIAQVPRWQEVTLEADVPFASLDARIAELAAARGVDTSRAFPVRVEGPLLDLHWHVIDGRKLAPGSTHKDHIRTAVTGTLAATEGTLVGFFSTQHHRVFTHMGTNTHFHVILADPPLTGHVDRVGLGRGARVFFPAAEGQ